MADALAAELVAGLNHPFIGGEHERGFATGLAHGFSASRIASAVSRVRSSGDE